MASKEKKLTKKQKIREYWNHGINPITGWHESHNTRLTGSGYIKNCFLAPVEPNGFVKQ
jgi:hypothetical protein